jgi:pyruvate kinase
MIQTPTPTRAEASDVANAVFDGTDAVMLSGETASGKFPILSVQTMVRIILKAEMAKDRYSRHVVSAPTLGSTVDAIESSAARIAECVNASVIACVSKTGRAVRVLAKYRPDRTMIAIVDNPKVLRKTAFYWGVRGILLPEMPQTDDVFQVIETLLRRHKWVKTGDLVVVTAGVPTLKGNTTNMVQVHPIGPIDLVKTSS